MCHSLTGTPCKVPVVHAQGKPAMSRRKHSCVSAAGLRVARPVAGARNMLLQVCRIYGAQQRRAHLEGALAAAGGGLKLP